MICLICQKNTKAQYTITIGELSISYCKAHEMKAYVYLATLISENKTSAEQILKSMQDDGQFKGYKKPATKKRK